MRHYRAEPLNTMIKGVVLISFTFFSCCFICSCQKGVDRLIQDLKDKKPEVRMQAAAALGEIKDTRAVEPLIAALKNTDSYVRSSAAHALGEIKDTRAVEPLIAALKDTDFVVRGSAARALGEIKDTRAVEPLIAALKDSDSYDRGYIVSALGEIKDTRAVEPLVAVLKDENSKIRKDVVDALGEIQGTRAVEPLIAALKNQDLEDMAANHYFFIIQGTPGTETSLIEALERYGTKEMAENFLNCGNKQLATAGREWAKKHGCTIITESPTRSPLGYVRPKWGKK